MRNLPLFIFLLLLSVMMGSPQQVHGQEVFNNVYEIPTYPNLRDVIVVDSGYVFGGGIVNPYISIIFGFINNSGVLQFTKSYVSNIFSLYTGYEGSMIKTTDHCYIIGGSTDTKGYLMKLDCNLNMMWLKFYQPASQTVITGCAETNNGYLISGYQVTNSYSRVILIKTDFEGNQLWYNYYGGQSTEAGYKIIRTIDGGFLLGGITYSYNPQVSQGNAGDWYLVKTDSLGNMQWQKHFGNPDWDDGRICGMIQAYDSCYIITGAYITHALDMDDKFSEGRILKLDKNGNIIWDKLSGYEGIYYPCILTILENDDHTLVSLAKDNANKDLLVKYSNDGNILWSRRFLMFGSNTADQMLEYVAKANDGGYVIAGWGLDNVNNQPQQAWLIKTDSLGCDGYQSCQDTALALHVSPHDTIIVLGQSVVIKTFVDNGKAPVTVTYSTGAAHYPVYLSFYDASDSIVFTPTQNTAVYVTASYGNSPGVMDSAVIHVIAGIHEQAKNDWFRISPNPARDEVSVDYSFSDKPPAIIDIITFQGISLKKVSINNTKGKINIRLRDLPGGVYYVKSRTCIRKLVVFK
ncbi:MAG: hypothetical protein NTW49_06790 [Bacteroidia bacterium]|nr:hypothetical protein [Bacteroidia bacterium]